MQSKFRLLVVRLGAMGDILHSLPAVTALRITHPEWIIDWVVDPNWRALLASDCSTGRDGGNPVPLQPVVDYLHLAPIKEWRARPLASKTRDEIQALRKALRTGEYDAVLDFQGALRSALIGRLAQCRRVIGEAKPRERAASLLFTEHVETCGSHVIEQDIELAAAVAGDNVDYVQPWLPMHPAAEKWADELLPLFSGRRSVLINPGAGWGAKRWPVDRYADVAEALIEQGCRVLVNAGPGEEAFADAIAEQTKGAAIPLFSSLERLIAVTRRVDLVIAGDTGPLHLACALGKPVVGIYGPTDPARNGPYGTRFKVLRHPDSRRDHARHEAPEAGLLTILRDDVVRAAEELLYPEAAS